MKLQRRFLSLPLSVKQGLEEEPKKEDFEEIELLGKGSFGRVYLAKHLITGAIYAIKEISKKGNQEIKEGMYTKRELEIMYKVRHPNIIKIYGHFETEQTCNILMEYASQGCLLKENVSTFSINRIAELMKELISAVYYLHHMDPPIIHRDIKGENVLIDEDGHVKLTDFGWSNYIPGRNRNRFTFCGTPAYLAPEMLTNEGHDKRVDIWCIGVLLFELLCGKEPFPGSKETLKQNILSIKIDWPKDINSNARNLLSKILKRNPNERLSLEEILKHPFFVNLLGDTSNCLIKPDNNDNLSPFIISKDFPDYMIAKKEKMDDNKEEDLNNQRDSWNMQNKQPEEVQMDSKKDELYHWLKQKYEELIEKYTELSTSKGEIIKQNNELIEKEKFMGDKWEKVNKEIKELENKIVDLTAKNSEMQQIILEKDDIIKAQLNQLSALKSEYDIKIKESNDKIWNYQTSLRQKEENEMQLRRRIEVLESELKKNQTQEPIIEICSFKNKEDENYNLRKSEEKYYQEFSIFKDYLDNVKNEMKNKYEGILKNKEEELEKLKKNQEEVEKTYDKRMRAYEEKLKEKEKQLLTKNFKLRFYQNQLDKQFCKKSEVNSSEENELYLSIH